MILPSTYAATLLLMIVSMICWGSWANTFKLTKKWRFELFYFDYSIGVLVAAVLAALTFGSMGDDFSFADNIAITGKRQIVIALVAGGLFNLANMLLVAAISISGLAVAFPVGIGIALIEGVLLNYLLNPQGNPYFVFAGVLLVFGAIILDALAYREHGKQVGTNLPFSAKGIVLSVISGVLMGLFYPLVEISKFGDNGLGPYSVAFFFAIGVFVTTPIFNVYFMNLPVRGEPIAMTEYLRGGTRRDHLLGILGGMIWCVGAVTNFVAASAPKTVNVGPAISYALGQCATMVSVLWGLLVWKEFRGATGKVHVLLALMMLLFLAGLGLLSTAPLAGR